MTALLAQTRIVVQIQFVEKGFPAALGADIFDGVTRDIEENWSEDRFMEWTRELEARYNRYTPKDLVNAHHLVNRITADQVKQYRIEGHAAKLIERGMQQDLAVTQAVEFYRSDEPISSAADRPIAP